jgi:hypothetical protein
MLIYNFLIYFSKRKKINCHIKKGKDGIYYVHEVNNTRHATPTGAPTIPINSDSNSHLNRKNNNKLHTW